MVCGICGSRMKIGRFRIMGGKTFTTVGWFDGDQLVCESNDQETSGFYCEGCGIMMGVFFRGRQVGFTDKYRQDLDENIDTLPKKTCPDCGAVLDVDYPRCPECGYLF